MYIMRRLSSIPTRISLAIAMLLGSCLMPGLGINLPAGPGMVIRPAINSSEAEIQQALDQLPPAGGVVWLTPGTYAITRPLLLNRNDLTLRGSGELTVLRLADRADCPVIIMGPVFRCATPILHDLCVSDLAIDGNRRNQLMERWADRSNTSGIENNGIIIQSASHSIVERVVAAHCRSGGLVTANGVRDLTVRDFTAYDNQFDGLAAYETEDSVFTKLNLHDNQSAGISLDLDFNHNLISDATLTGNDLGIFMRDSSDNQFRRLAISQSRHYGVFMAQWVRYRPKGWSYTPQTECAGNLFDGLKIQGCGGDAFCIHDPSCVSNVIQNEIFSGNLNNRLVLAGAKRVHPPGLASAKN